MPRGINRAQLRERRLGALVRLEEQKKFLFKFFDGDGRLKFSTLLKEIQQSVASTLSFNG